MSNIKDKYVVGPWVIHHGRKLAQVQEGAADFPVIDVAAKSATLLARIGTTNDSELTHPQVESIARYIGLNQYLELPEILRILEKKTSYSIYKYRHCYIGYNLSCCSRTRFRNLI